MICHVHVGDGDPFLFVHNRDPITFEVGVCGIVHFLCPPFIDEKGNLHE
jgi:hypothetical protein